MADIKVKYCQLLLKSIPATINLAEEIYMKKLSMVSRLPNSTSELKAFIDFEQKPLTMKIQRHLLFFAGLKYKFILPFSKQVIEGLQKALQLIVEYINVLDQESSVLVNNDIQTFLQLWKREQDIQYNTASLFEKRPNLKERNIFSTLYDAGRVLLSPISHSMVFLVILAATSFQTSAFQPPEMIIQVNNSHTITTMTLDAYSIANMLNRLGNTKGILARDVLGSPTIIIKEDVHGTPEYEIDFVKTTFKLFGINAVAMEGWAGAEEDAARGYTVINAEEEFITHILKDPTYFKIGLEDPELQEKTLQLILVRDIINYKKEKADKINNIKELENEINKFKEDYLKDPINTERRIKNSENCIDGIKQDIQKIDCIIEEMGEREAELLAQLHITLPELIELNKDLLDKTPEEIKVIWNEVGVVGRSKAWARKLIKQMKESNINGVVAVVGRGHSKSFIEELQKEAAKVYNGINIIVVSSEKP